MYGAEAESAGGPASRSGPQATFVAKVLRRLEGDTEARKAGGRGPYERAPGVKLRPYATPVGLPQGVMRDAGLRQRAFALLALLCLAAAQDANNCEDWVTMNVSGCPSAALWNAANNPDWILDPAWDRTSVIEDARPGADYLAVAYFNPSYSSAPTEVDTNHSDGRRLVYFEFNGETAQLPLYIDLSSSTMISKLTVGVWFRTDARDTNPDTQVDNRALLDFDGKMFFSAFLTPQGYLAFSHAYRETSDYNDMGTTHEQEEPGSLPHLADGVWHYGTFVFDCIDEGTVDSDGGYGEYITCPDGVRLKIYRDGALTVNTTVADQEFAIGLGSGAGEERKGRIGDGGDGDGYYSDNTEDFFEGDVAMVHFSRHLAATDAQVKNMYLASRIFYQTCPPGYFCETAVHQTCPGGYFCPGDFDKYACGVGNYCPPGSNASTPVPAGFALSAWTWTPTRTRGSRRALLGTTARAARQCSRAAATTSSAPSALPRRSS